MRLVRSYGNAHDHVLFFRGKSTVHECLVQPLSKRACLPCHVGITLVISFAIERVFADDKDPVPLIFQNEPFDVGNFTSRRLRIAAERDLYETLVGRYLLELLLTYDLYDTGIRQKHLDRLSETPVVSAIAFSLFDSCFKRRYGFSGGNKRFHRLLFRRESVELTTYGCQLDIELLYCLGCFRDLTFKALLLLAGEHSERITPGTERAEFFGRRGPFHAKFSRLKCHLVKVFASAFKNDYSLLRFFQLMLQGLSVGR